MTQKQAFKRVLKRYNVKIKIEIKDKYKYDFGDDKNTKTAIKDKEASLIFMKDMSDFVKNVKKGVVNGRA